VLCAKAREGRASARPGKQTLAPPQAACSPETQHPRTPVTNRLPQSHIFGLLVP